MQQVFFNSFKEKILSGKVDDVITASGMPFNSDFLDTYDNNDISIEQYRTLSDFVQYSKGNSATSFEDTKFDYVEYGVEYSSYYGNDVSEKPIFVNPENYDKFLEIYSGEIRYSDPYVKEKFDYYVSDDENINSGFYYITKKSQLKWISERCNNIDNFNNRIIVVMGDDIGNVVGSNKTVLDTVICNDPNRPFAGIFDFNGHKISNLTIRCKENSNGLIGYLGPDGIVRDGIVQDVEFECMNKISLDKIRDDCSDVVVGGVVGTNYGTVENILSSGYVQFNGFCPEVYLTENKYEYEDFEETVSNKNYNCFFPNKFCLNSIYNVIPYVGYFCEGTDSYFNDVGNPLFYTRKGMTGQHANIPTPEWLYWNVRNNIDPLIGIKLKTTARPKKYTWAYNYDHYLEGKLANSVLYDQSSVELGNVIPQAFGVDRSRDSGDGIHHNNDQAYFADVYRTVMDNSGEADNFSPLFVLENDQRIPERLLMNSICNLGEYETWNGEDEIDIEDSRIYYQNGGLDNEYGSYVARMIRDQILLYLFRGEKVNSHQKMNPYSRIAYYCSPIVGNNFGTIRNIDCRHTLVESKNTFVGFIGGVCGKENCGTIENVNAVLDIREDDRDSHSDLDRVYTNNMNWKPEYDESYANIVNVFGYNWDYYQTENGIDEEHQKYYSACSAECVKTSDRFYEYHDLTYSGVQASKLNQYTFNIAHKYCNFRVSDEITSADSYIQDSDVPSDLKDAKMKMSLKIADSGDYTPEEFCTRIVCSNEDFSSAYSTFKLFNPYDADKNDNCYERLEIESTDLSEAFDEMRIKHIELSYIGDACKYTSVVDSAGEYDEKSTQEGDYTPTNADVLNYCPSFNGEAGKTVDNAYEFANNISNAKIAVGCEMLANPSLNVDYSFPGGNKPMSGRNPEGLFGCVNESESGYVIPAQTGPNDTTTDWELGDDLPNYCWYMQPGKYEEETYNGPEAFDPEIKQYLGSESSGYILNTGSNKPNFFCSIHPEGLWDLYGDTKGLGNTNPYNEKDNYSKASIPRSVLTITFLEGENGTEDLAEKIAEAASKSSFWTKTVGNDYEVKINKISIPLANRTQNEAKQSSSFEGLNGYNGIFLYEKKQKLRYSMPADDRETVEPADDDPTSVGNLDKMYIDISVIVEEDVNHSSGNTDTSNDTYRVYPMIVEVPISELYIPISVVHESVAPRWEITQKYSEDLANIVNLNGSGTNVRARDVEYFHLVPAFDMLDMTGTAIEFKLSSIYNVGGICGMINHSQSFIEHGNYELVQKSGYDPSIVNDDGTVLSYGANSARTGSIVKANVRITDRSIDFIRSTLLYNRVADKMIEINDHTIGIANKFAGVAAVYEYRQNDLGTSPRTRVDGCDTDGLQRQDFQKFIIRDVIVTGSETNYCTSPVSRDVAEKRSLFSIFSKVFSPLIEWANISNILDTTNFFQINDIRDTALNYVSRQASNFPIAGNVMADFSVSQYGGGSLGTFNGASDSYLVYDRWPILDKGQVWIGDSDAISEGVVIERKMNRVGSTIGVDEYAVNGDEYPRLWGSRKCFKTYDLFPSVLLDIDGFSLYGDIEDPYSEFYIHMNPAANSPSSEYYDVYMPMFSGNGHFLNRKLSKPIMSAPVPADVSLDLDRALEASDMKIINQKLIDFFNWRYVSSGGITDRYFTWDYDTTEVIKSDLLFTIRYMNVDGKRGLWIHQHDRADFIEKLRYPMADGVYNDGSNIHIGYMPSTEGIVRLLNTADDDSIPENQFDEGRAVTGSDFRGILLFDTRDDSLIAVIDSMQSRDLICGCYVAELPEKTTVDDTRYGLLTVIVAE